jgi:hypothetical protein
MGLTQKLGTIPLAILTDASNNVGIGAAPSGSYKLEVTGTAKVSSTLLLGGALTGTSATFSGAGVDVFSSSGIGTSAVSGLFRVVTFGTSSGIAIGQSNSTRYTSIAANDYKIYNDDFFLSTNGAFPLVLGTNNTARLIITSAGNVQIDDSSSSSKLAVKGGNSTYPASSSASYTLSLNDPTSSAINVGGSLIFQGFKTSTTSGGNFAGIVGKKENGTAGNEAGFLGFLTGDSAGTFSERMRITSGGYTKMTNSGSYNSAGGTYHEMVQNLNNYQSATISHTGTNPYGLEINFANTDPNNATNWGLGFYSALPSFVWIYRIYSNGTVAARSDARWKKNIETTRNGYLEDLCKLRVVKYNWYNHEEYAPKELGLIAQEVEEVFPNLISYDKVTTKKQVEQEDGTFIEEEFEDGESRSVKISVLPFMLLKALQEANSKIEELNERLNKAGL